MENASDGLPPETSLPEILNNGEVMAKFSDVEREDVKEDNLAEVKVNGNARLEAEKIHQSEDSDSSDYDTLVIDESVNSLKNDSRKIKGGFKGFKNTPDNVGNYMHTSNPYFAESIFELFEKSQEKPKQKESEPSVEKKSNCKNHKHVEKKGKSNPKLREYAQYLGLQPTVQFKCSKCSRAGFPSWASLNEHISQCNETAPVNNLTSGSSVSGVPSTNIRVTRKVFLCSACGTYYENWNLFLHMREVHKRYICLYCLGMFSHPDKLSLHIVSKHNCVPNHINSPEEFYNIYKEPCFLMCCECQKGFTETDNFFEHQCIESISNNLKTKTSLKQNSKTLKPIGHVTADSNIKIEENSLIESNDNATDISEQNFCNSIEDNVDKLCNQQIKYNSCDSLKITESQSIEVDSETNLESCQTQDECDEMFKTMETQQESLTCDSNLTESRANTGEKLDDNESIMQQIESLPQCDDDTIHNDALSVSFHDSNDSFSVQSPKNSFETYCKEEDELRTEDDGVIETRKVPKVTLKLKDFEYKAKEEGENYESDDSEKLTMEVDQIENESQESNTNLEETNFNSEPQFQVAGPDVPIIELELEQPLDKFDPKVLLQKCLGTTIATCVYCNYARKISVNGKQLGLHAIAEHRFSAVVNSITAEELIPESFVGRIKDTLSELENVYFNLECNSSDEAITFSHIFECFQCRYSTTIHKELYLHNRKMHAKSILLCIMCKSNFYSYSELICHLCPGVYELDRDIHFRCCMCISDELPSAFRLMVHLRKRHHACDVCLELCHSQSKLSNHVWKHKLHHLCYRCGIAYRNKPDITKHLFWKHGTESVLCKKCLQKKWPHVYHFCIPPPSFLCEECNLSFSKAVYLMVHKRTHTEEKPHACMDESCGEKFISKKLLLKHEFKHREPQEEPAKEPEKQENENTPMETEATSSTTNETQEIEVEDKTGKPKPKVDVLDLPELNLSESDSSDSEDNAPKCTGVGGGDKNEKCDKELEQEQPPPVLGTIWDDFRNYQANKDKDDRLLNDDKSDEILEVIMKDHDYCVVPEKPEEEVREIEVSADHDYCFEPKSDGQVANSKSPQKKHSSSSDSSSDSDSSSCTCGSNCSCSSSSGSSNSTSDSSESDSSSSEGRRRQQARRERRKQKTKTKKSENKTAPPPPTNDVQPTSILEVPIQESDLETTESDTDEDFYDKQPQKLANKLLAEKKNQLLQMAAIGPYINGSIMDGSRPPTPSLPEEPKPKKKSKSKKRKKKNKSSKYEAENPNKHIPNYQPVAPITLTLPKHSPSVTPVYNSPSPALNLATPSQSQLAQDADTSLRASKRRRVPNKFYGYSSDEEHEKVLPPPHKWRKADLPTPRSPLVVPPITIKTLPPPIDHRPAPNPGEYRHHIKPFHIRPPPIPKIKPLAPPPAPEQESASDSNDSSSDDEHLPLPVQPPTQPQPALYCYCRCPYDEVSEMIGCDSSDCAIEWFHFECVGIMVPPKGQWFCPDCRKKKQQRRELLQGHMM